MYNAQTKWQCESQNRGTSGEAVGEHEKGVQGPYPGLFLDISW